MIWWRHDKLIPAFFVQVFLRLKRLPSLQIICELQWVKAKYESAVWSLSSGNELLSFSCPFSLRGLLTFQMYSFPILFIRVNQNNIKRYKTPTLYYPIGSCERLVWRLCDIYYCLLNCLTINWIINLGSWNQLIRFDHCRGNLRRLSLMCAMVVTVLSSTTSGSLRHKSSKLKVSLNHCGVLCIFGRWRMQVISFEEKYL